MYATRHPDGSNPNREDLAAYSANILDGYFRASDPDGKLGLSDLLRNVWRGRKPESAKPAADNETSRPVPPNPGPEAPPAAIVPPAVERDIGELAAADTTAMLTLADVKRTLQPFVAFATEQRDVPDFSYFAIRSRDDAGTFSQVDMVELRALIRAAGLWTDEMQAPQPPAAPGPAAKPAEDDTPPPAEGAADYAGADDPVVSGHRKTFGGEPLGITTADDAEEAF